MGLLVRGGLVVGFNDIASNYASPGLTVLRRRSPGPPAPAQAGTRGAINYFRQKIKLLSPKSNYTALLTVAEINYLYANNPTTIDICVELSLIHI